MELLYSEIIKKQRQARAWSQEHLAQVAGVSPRTIQRIENGQPASFDTLNAIASAFDIDVKDFTKRPTASKSSVSTSLLLRIRSGSDLFKIIGGSHAFQFDHTTLESETETDTGEQLQDLHDWGELWNEIEPGQKVRTAQEFNDRIADLEESGLWVFAMRVPRPYEFSSKKVTLEVAMVNIVRSKLSDHTNL